MNVKILNCSSNQEIDARIVKPDRIKLPSIQEGWRFNFSKHSKDKDAHTYILVATDTPDTIEGCLIYKMKDQQEPYMAFIELAPHNRSENKKYDLVAGCLIAYACRLSFILGKADYQGWLAFDVQEQNQEDQIKLMTVYSKKYYAYRIADTTAMCIMPKDGERLFEEYLDKK